MLRTWIGKAEGSEGRVVGVGDVDGEAFDAGCGPEGGQVEGGVILAIEVGPSSCVSTCISKIVWLKQENTNGAFRLGRLVM